MEQKKEPVKVKDKWQEIVDIIATLGEPFATNIKYAYLLSDDKNNIKIAYDESRKFIFDFMSSKDNLLAAHNKLKSVYGADMMFEYILNIDSNKNVETIADIASSESLELQRKTLEIVKADPFVKSLMDNLSATIINIEPIIKDKK